MDRPAVRIGFVGVGAMGQCAHLRNYVTTSGCEVVALAELRPELGRRVAARYGVENVYRDHREMLAAEKLDAIVSIQHFSLHGQLLPEILAAGLPTLIEKPLARSVEAGERIVACPNSDKLFIGYHKRSDPATLWALDRIAKWKASGEVGPMRYVRVTMPPGDWMARGFSGLIDCGERIPPAPSDPPASPQYEAFVNYYIHQVNLIRLLLGENYRVMFADPIVLVGRSDGGGVTCVLEMKPYRTVADWQEAALVTFAAGWIRLELPAPMTVDRPGQITVFEDPGDVEPSTSSPTLPPVHAMRRQAEQFVAAVRGEKTTLCRADEALEDLRVARQYLELLERQPR
jgi:predicted dehydrogenase